MDKLRLYESMGDKGEGGEYRQYREERQRLYGSRGDKRGRSPTIHGGKAEAIRIKR